MSLDSLVVACSVHTAIHTESVDVLVVTMLVKPFERPAAAVVKENCAGVIELE